MSNFLSIATVTEALRQMLETALKTDVPGAVATAVRPSGAAGGAAGGLPAVGVNVFLYQVTPNGAWRNTDLPTRWSDGTLVERPRAAIDLHYLLSFYGSETRLEPQLLLGSALRTLHARPVLTRQNIQSAINAANFLAKSNLADQVEHVKFTPLPLSLEELSKLWSVFFQTPYTLSVAQQASVVLIESQATPQEALPVRERKVHVRPFERPVIEAVTPQTASAGATLTLAGVNLRGDVTRVRIGSDLVIPAAVGADEVSVKLPATLPAGVRTVQVVHLLDLGTAKEPHAGFESNVAAFVLVPKITTAPPISVARGATLALAVSPPVGRTQLAVLYVGDRAIRIESRKPDGAPTAALDFPIPADFPAGKFLLRLQIDGAESPLDADSKGRYTGPEVTLT